MGADASAYLYWAVNFDDIFVEKVEKEVYDIHDKRTGEKTGEKGFDMKTYFVNIHNGKKYPDDISQLGIKDEFIHRLDQDSPHTIIGIPVARVTEENGGSEIVDPEKLKAAKEKLDSVLLTHLLTGTGLIAKANPKLILNLYWSY